jgi:phthalate 4,5-dioxygenase
VGLRDPEPDGTPVRPRVLSEDLVAFRDTHGKIGIIDAYCPHRRAGLFFGRNEECGLRCVYHGWKFDVHGNCVDMPSEPRESTFKDKVKAKAYPTAEYGGCIWIYMGPPDKQPALPHLEWARVPASQRVLSRWIQACNYMQAVEGEIDSAHVSWLHAPLQAEDSPFRGRFNDAIIRDGAPRLTISQDTAMTESMGGIVDRTQEHLGTTDVAVIAARRRLIKMAQDLRDGVEPTDALRPEIYNVRAVDMVCLEDDFFQFMDLYADEAVGKV